jgi:hypothetical protein
MSAGRSPPVNKEAIETLVTEPIVISTRVGGIVSVCAPVADQKSNKITRLGASLPHFRKKS